MGQAARRAPCWIGVEAPRNLIDVRETIAFARHRLDITRRPQHQREQRDRRITVDTRDGKTSEAHPEDAAPISTNPRHLISHQTQCEQRRTVPSLTIDSVRAQPSGHLLELRRRHGDDYKMTTRTGKTR